MSAGSDICYCDMCILDPCAFMQDAASMPTALAVPLLVLLCRQRLAATHLLIGVMLMTLIVVQLSLGVLHCQLLSLYLIVDAIVVILQLGSIRPAAQSYVA